jgi:hypothetical protein
MLPCSDGEHGRVLETHFNVLEEAKEMQVVLANSQQVKNLQGHKTDPNDSRWHTGCVTV